MKRSSITENAYVEEKMTAGVRHAKTFCVVLMIVDLLGIFPALMEKTADRFFIVVGVLVSLMLIRWLFDGLESIIGLLCSLKTAPSRGSKLPDAAFPQHDGSEPEKAKYDSHETAGE